MVRNFNRWMANKLFKKQMQYHDGVAKYRNLSAEWDDWISLPNFKKRWYSPPKLNKSRAVYLYFKNKRLLKRTNRASNYFFQQYVNSKK